MCSTFFFKNFGYLRVKYLNTLTDCTAPKGPNNCQRTFSSVSGAKLYTKIHHPDPLMVLVDIIELASISFVRGEYLEDAKLFFKVKISYSDLDSNFLFGRIFWCIPEPTCCVMNWTSKSSACWLRSQVSSQRCHWFATTRIVCKFNRDCFIWRFWNRSIEFFDCTLCFATLIEPNETHAFSQTLKLGTINKKTVTEYSERNLNLDLIFGHAVDSKIPKNQNSKKYPSRIKKHVSCWVIKLFCFMKLNLDLTFRKVHFHWFKFFINQNINFQMVSNNLFITNIFWKYFRRRKCSVQDQIVGRTFEQLHESQTDRCTFGTKLTLRTNKSAIILEIAIPFTSFLYFVH